jgi:hypothetical protein
MRCSSRALPWIEKCFLGNLDLDPPSVDTVAVGEFLEEVGGRVDQEFARRDIDRHPDRRKVEPVYRLQERANALTYEAEQRIGQFQTYCGMHDIRRGNLARLRVPPPQQSFEADRFAGGHRDLRLEFDVKLALLQRPRQIELNAALVSQFVMHLGIKHPYAGPPVVLGAIERRVGSGKQVLNVDHAGGVCGNPDRAADRQRVAGDLERFFQRRCQLVGERERSAGDIRTLEHDDELVAAQPDGQIVGPADRAKQVGDGFDDPIAHLVAAGIVDRFEAVDVYEDEGDARPEPHAATAKSRK